MLTMEENGTCFFLLWVAIKMMGDRYESDNKIFVTQCFQYFVQFRFVKEKKKQTLF